MNQDTRMRCMVVVTNVVTWRGGGERKTANSLRISDMLIFRGGTTRQDLSIIPIHFDYDFQLNYWYQRIYVSYKFISVHYNSGIYRTL